MARRRFIGRHRPGRTEGSSNKGHVPCRVITGFTKAVLGSQSRGPFCSLLSSWHPSAQVPTLCCAMTRCFPHWTQATLLSAAPAMFSKYPMLWHSILHCSLKAPSSLISLWLCTCHPLCVKTPPFLSCYLGKILFSLQNLTSLLKIGAGGSPSALKCQAALGVDHALSRAFSRPTRQADVNYFHLTDMLIYLKLLS